MKSDAVAFGVAGVVFGLIAGWILGSQQSATRVQTPPTQASAPAQPSSSTPALIDETKVTAYKSVAEREPTNAKPRVELGNLYFDAERYDDAVKWYSEAVRLDPRDPNVSTDLGVSYYYTNQPDRALELFTQSLKLDPKHLKTILNVGVVKAFGKQDLEGAEAAWQQVIALAPESPEGKTAKRALDSLRAAHPSGGSPSKPGA
jgi:cytochrome c-type biogenesis protein CcmH/NrfG